MLKKSRLALIITATLAAYNVTAEVYTVDKVVVSATRSNQAIENTAAAVVVISDETIEKNITRNIDELFSYTPGVDIQSDSRQGVQSVNIRGLQGNRIKIVVDGVSQANQFENNYSFINSGRVDVDVDMLKSVEVVKGASSSLQGSDAIGGVVSFQTKDPIDFLSKDNDFGGHLKLSYSSADSQFKESIALAQRLGKLETLLAYTRQDAEEVDNFGVVEDQNSDANNILAKLQYQLTEQHRIEFTGEYVNSAINTHFDNALYSNYLGDDTSDRVRLGIKHIWLYDAEFADTITWQIDYLDKEQNSITERTFLSSGNEQTKNYNYRDKGWQGHIQLDKVLMLADIEHFLVYGATFSTKDIENINNEYNSVGNDQQIFYMPAASELRYGLFIQDEISTGNLVITPGIRFDSFATDPDSNFPSDGSYDQSLYKDYSDSAITGRLGALYSLNEQNKVFSQISQGFRAPDFQQLFYSFGNPMHGYESIPNPDLKAEDSTSYELGWRHNVNGSFTELSFFISDYDNFIEYQQVGISDSGLYQSQYMNIDEATIKGVEIANTLDWFQAFGIAQGISTRIAANYTEGEDGDGNALNSVNPWNAVLGINYDALSGHWGAGVKIKYIAAKKASDITPGQDFMGQPMDAFAPDSALIVDVNAYYTPVKNLTLRVGLFNLTDEEYYNWSDVSAIEAEDSYYTQAKRNVGVTVKYDF
ncbi:TonB-dependent hemoglobin/transferrin/lactoferrin family receptor [Colwellia ponticola]|uniref:TonB-dependent hemoglobin/transferrin/lactoferrin family receptor n=1 Tax=Colwellia ponticola TaxID=2304625 RepID=A0A8H2JLE9_9GAMM|nr:TonB-dependent hemoglobin/transferrin/lactoferrin family receptor [Colwellia ponticola]TMM45239.1 TonB-dependent hemoglobin/transferrin/lactoferrin family receptor [Colwellia ponticola]